MSAEPIFRETMQTNCPLFVLYPEKKQRPQKLKLKG